MTLISTVDDHARDSNIVGDDIINNDLDIINNDIIDNDIISNDIIDNDIIIAKDIFSIIYFDKVVSL